MGSVLFVSIDSLIRFRARRQRIVHDRSRAWIAAMLLPLWLGVLAASASPAASTARPLADRLSGVLGQPAFAGARIGVLVVRQRDGATIFAKEPDRLLIPASNMKILTAIGALSVFGPSHRFETRIMADRAPDSGGAIGQLEIIGGGDPVMNSEDWWRLAADLHRAGLRRIEGDILVDDSLFDAKYWHPGWSGISARAYHAPVSALTANYGAFFIAVEPGSAAGDPVAVSIDPSIPYLRVVNRAKTGGPRSPSSLTVDPSRTAENVEVVDVAGQLQAGDARDVFPRSVNDAALYAGSVFAMQLEAVGIEIGGSVKRASKRLPVEIAKHEGRPLAEIVRLFMKYSNNSIAESLVKSLAVASGSVPGSWPAGMAALEGELGRLGLLTPGAVLVDGSGLSPQDRVSARMLVDALRIGSDSFRFGPEFLSALPIAHRDGTLERRATASAERIRAKTGLLSDQRVTTLSGLAELADGELAVFSILLNAHPGGSSAAMDAVDRLAAELTR